MSSDLDPKPIPEKPNKPHVQIDGDKLSSSPASLYLLLHVGILIVVLLLVVVVAAVLRPS